MDVTLTVGVLVESLQNLEKCIQSIRKQTLKQIQVILFTNQLLDIDLNKQEQIRELSTCSLSEMLTAMNRMVNTDFVTFISSKDFYLKEDALEKTLNQLQEQRADCAITDFTRLEEGMFHFYQCDPGLHGIVTSNNILPYMRKNQNFRMMSCLVMHRDILPKLITHDLRDSEQRLIYFAAHVAKKMIVVNESAFCWVKDNRRYLPGFTWYEDYRYSPMAEVVTEIRKSDYQEVINYPINVAICINDQSLKYLDTMLYSLNKNCQDIHLYVVYQSLSQASLSQIQFMDSLLPNLTIHFREIPKELVQMLLPIPMKKRFPLETYFRILLPEVLSDLYRVIYLDTDVLVLKNLKELWDTPLEGNFLAACQDSLLLGNRLEKKHHPLFGEQEEGNYFNSGVLLMDIDLMRKYRTTYYLISLCIDVAHLSLYFDQDALNLFFFGANKRLGIEYDFSLAYMYFEPQSIRDLSVIHYHAMGIKPWEINRYSELFDVMQLFRQYRNEAKVLFGECAFKVSVIIDARKAHGDNYQRCIESLLIQQYTNLEIFIRVDESLPIEVKRYVERLESYYPRRIFVTYQSLGQILQVVSGDYIYFQNVDNYLDKDDELSQIVGVGDFVVSSANVFNQTKGMFYIYSKGDKINRITSSDNNRLSYFHELVGVIISKKFLDTLNWQSNFDNQQLIELLDASGEELYYLDIRNWMKAEF